MNIHLKAYTVDPATLCGDAAAICTASEDRKRSLSYSLSSGHESVLEHVSFTFQVDGLSRASLAQLTRHRLASYSVQSQRFVRILGIDMVLPASIRNSEFYGEAGSLMEDVMNLYQRMVDAGIPPEDARYVTPQAVPTSLILTMNARELRHFFALRCCNRAQWEIRQMADQMLEMCKDVASELFEDAGPGCIRGHCPEAHPCGQSRFSNH